MKKVTFKNCTFILSVFFAMNPDLKAMNRESEEAPQDPWGLVSTSLENPGRIDLSEEDVLSMANSSHSSESLFSQASTAMEEWMIPIQQMKYDTLKEAYARIARKNNITRSFEHRKLRTLSDRHIQAAANNNKTFLYCSSAHIRNWQIAEEISKIINEIDDSANLAISIEHLKGFKKAALQEYELSLFERREFLKHTLNIAAELSMWKTLYNNHRSHFETENADVSKKILAFFNDKDITYQCENLYKEKDFVDGSLAVKLRECLLFIHKIRSLIVPLIGGTEEEVAIGQSAQMEKFLEKVQVAFENPETMSLYFNREDGEIFLDVLAASVDFYKTQRAQVEGAARAQAAEQAAAAAQQAAAAAQSAIEEERAARMAADKAARVAEALAAAAIESERAAQKVAAQEAEAARISSEAAIAAERTRAEAKIAAAETRNKATVDAAIIKAIAAEKAAQLTAEAFENTKRIKKETDAEAARIMAEARAALAEAREEKIRAESAAEIARSKIEAATEAKKYAQEAQWRANEDRLKQEERESKRIWRGGATSVVGAGAGAIAYAAGAPVLIPATLAAVTIGAVGATIQSLFF